MNRLQALISTLGTIARPAALERIPAPSSQFGLLDYSDLAAERNGSELADAEAPKTSGGGSIKGGTSMTQNPFATAQQVSPRPQERAGYSVREVAGQYGVSEPFVRLEIKRGNLRA